MSRRFTAKRRDGRARRVWRFPDREECVLYIGCIHAGAPNVHCGLRFPRRLNRYRAAAVRTPVPLLRGGRGDAEHTFPVLRGGRGDAEHTFPLPRGGRGDAEHTFPVLRGYAAMRNTRSRCSASDRGDAEHTSRARGGRGDAEHTFPLPRGGRCGAETLVPAAPRRPRRCGIAKKCVNTSVAESVRRSLVEGRVLSDRPERDS